jgi:hypothetical protein
MGTVLPWMPPGVSGIKDRSLSNPAPDQYLGTV